MLSKRTSTERAIFDAKLLALAQGSALDRRAHINLGDETRVTEAAWNELIDSIVSTNADLAELRMSVRLWARNWLLKGDAARCGMRTIFGRATTIPALATILVNGGHFGSIAAATTHVQFMLSQKVDVIRANWKSYELGRHMMWATFAPGGGFPFDGFPTSCDQIRGLLGLSRSDIGTPLLLLQYVITSPTTARFPTVADAYAGDHWAYYFQPAVETETNHGWTMTWDEYSGQPSRPEVVHDVVRGEVLVNQLRLIP